MEKLRVYTKIRVELQILELKLKNFAIFLILSLLTVIVSMSFFSLIAVAVYYFVIKTIQEFNLKTTVDNLPDKINN